MENEGDRVWRILVDEIQTKKLMIQRWRNMKENTPNMPDTIIEEQVRGFTLELSALVGLGVKLFGMKHEDLEAL